MNNRLLAKMLRRKSDASSQGQALPFDPDPLHLSKTRKVQDENVMVVGPRVPGSDTTLPPLDLNHAKDTHSFYSLFGQRKPKTARVFYRHTEDDEPVFLGELTEAEVLPAVQRAERERWEREQPTWRDRVLRVLLLAASSAVSVWCIYHGLRWAWHAFTAF